MKSAAELRLENLETLVKEAGTADALAEACGLSPEYISQIRNRAVDKKTGRARNLGSQAARKLETGMRKPLGWMDTNHAAPHKAEPSSEPWPLTKATVERIRALTPQQQRQADDAFDIILRGFEAERDKG
ncbi:hypothetical protein [Paracandidimonas lactea]|uniref:hypothetical protein n=1 Tax=Paracandidimonas lactea TaxID=2895524 RepID=UPI001F34F9FC|nr:hypothetical protein [Paracandidimonas lactea]